MRNDQIDKLQRNAGFMEEWQQKGIEEWKKNQTLMKDRQRRTLEFEYTQAKNYKDVTMKKVSSATEEVHGGIDAFEKTLKSKGINPDGPTQGGFSPGKTKSMSTTTFQRSHKRGQHTRAMTEQQRKERERRRLVRVVDQNKLLLDMDNERREKQLIERLKRQSKQEEELNYEIWRTQQCKTIISENRKLREARYYKRKDLDENNAVNREEEMIRTLDEQRKIDEESQMERESDQRVTAK